MIRLILFMLVLAVACTPKQSPEQIVEDKAEINRVLDDWHDAAADAEFERYFAHFADSGSIFMGTDATERWTRTEFASFSKPYFDRGRAWSFTPVQRTVYVSEDGNTAWFDEELDTPNLGPSRGTGVLVHKENEWKIAHYNLTVPIPNAIMNDVKDQIERTLNNEQ